MVKNVCEVKNKSMACQCKTRLHHHHYEEDGEAYQSGGEVGGSHRSSFRKTNVVYRPTISIT